MRRRFTHVAGRVLLAAVLVWAQTAALRAQGTPAAGAGEPEHFSIEQIDALLAPIALFPDALLTQMLMASAFPIQIVNAARWLEQPGRRDLEGEALADATANEPWDPGVRSLVAIPDALFLMNAHLDWTQQLGYAFAGQPEDVLDSIQRLRMQAQEAGYLKTTPEQTVVVRDRTVVIEPANPQVVFVPQYSPTVVFGGWPYAAVQPVVLGPPPGAAIATGLATGLAFGAGIAITNSLWGWGRPNWGRRYVNVNVSRYTQINRGRPPTWSGDRWRPPPRTGARVGPPVGPVGRPIRSGGVPPNVIGRPSVRIPQGVVDRPVRDAAQPGGRLEGARERIQANPQRPAPNRQQAPQGGGQRRDQAGAPSRPEIRQRVEQQRGQGGGPDRAAAVRQQAQQRRDQGAPPVRGQAASRVAERRDQGAFSGTRDGARAQALSARGNESRAHAARDGGRLRDGARAARNR